MTDHTWNSSDYNLVAVDIGLPLDCSMADRIEDQNEADIVVVVQMDHLELDHMLRRIVESAALIDGLLLLLLL